MTKLEYIGAGIEGVGRMRGPSISVPMDPLLLRDDRRNESRKNAILDIGLKQMLVSNPKLRPYLLP